MRLPESKIRDAIVHPERSVRGETLRYFADCYSRDSEAMPMAIRAIEMYGRSDAFFDLHDLAQLAQTEATVEWAIKALDRDQDGAHDRDRFFPALSLVLCSADTRLVEPRAAEILQAQGFSKDSHEDFQERLRLASWDADQCWHELQRVSAQAVGESFDVDFDYADRLVEVLARKGEKYVDRILDLLAKEVEDIENDPISCLQIFLVVLAGEMRLERAVSSVVKKLHECDDAISEDCVEALGKIGTDAAATAVAEGWLDAAWDYRLYAASALERIHSDTTVRQCLELMPQEKDLLIRTELADALLTQFADESIEPVRAMVDKRAYDATHSDLMRRLVAISTVVGVSFPEYPIWKRQAEERLADQERRIKEMSAPLRSSAKTAPRPKASREQDDVDERKPTPYLRTEKQVGRNDPCPCGSGKKFKKCCMSKAR
jgi:hypothetical protein